MEYYYIDQTKMQEKIDKDFYSKYTEKKFDQKRQLAPNTPQSFDETNAKDYKKNKKEFL